MATRAETLLVRIDGDLSKLKAELNKGEVATISSGRRMTLALGGVERGALALTRGFSRLHGIVLGLVAGGFALLVKRHLDLAAQIEGTAGKIGISTTALQELRFAAEQSADTIATSFDSALQAFSTRVAEAASGTGKFKDTLRQYGIEVTDGANRMRPLEDVLGDVAEATRTAGSGQEQLRIATKAFGAEGAGLVNMLKLGRDGIKGLREEAERLGIPLDENLIKKAREGERALAKMGDVLRSNLQRALIAIAPALERVSELIARMAPGVQRFVEGSFLPDDLKGFDALGRALDRAQQELVEFEQTSKTTLGKFFAQLSQALGGQGANEVEQNLRNRILRLQVLIEAARDKPDPGLVIDINAGPRQAIIDQLQKQERAIKAETEAVFLNRGEKAKLTATEKAREEAIRQNLDLTPAVLSAFDAETEKIRIATDALEQQERQLRVVDGAADGLSDSLTALGSAAEEGSSRGQAAFRALGNAAVSVLRDIQREIIRSALRGAIGGLGIEGFFSGLFGGGGAADSVGVTATVAKGGAFRGGRRLAFARGGIVNAPTVFPMAAGLGLMGEAGPEAVMPLRRGPGGRLGVDAGRGGGAGVNVYQTINVTAGVAPTVRAEMLNMLPAILRAAKDGVAQAKQDGQRGFAS